MREPLAIEGSKITQPLVWDAPDENIRGLIDLMNSMPGIETVGSCGGHEYPNLALAQRPLGEWFVTFFVDIQQGGWVSLEQLASLFSFLHGTNVEVCSNCMGKPKGLLTFALVGKTSLPEQAESLLRAMRDDAWDGGFDRQTGLQNQFMARYTLKHWRRKSHR